MSSHSNTLNSFFQNIATGDISRISPFLNSNIIDSNCTDETNQNAIFYAAMTIKDDLQCLSIIKQCDSESYGLHIGICPAGARRDCGKRGQSGDDCAG